MHTSSAEQESSQVVADIVAEIIHALDSLGGKTHNGLFDNYRFYSSKHLQRACEAFVYLRQSGRVDGSKFLVRPVIEMMFRLQAVRKHPELLYRIAYSERVQDEKLLRRAAEASNFAYNETEMKTKWREFSDLFKKEFPKLQADEKELSVFEIAEKAGLAAFYHSHYRTYCQFTHGAMRASGGHLDEVTDPEDNRTMALCAFVALDALASLGADSPNREALFKRLPQHEPGLKMDNGT